MTSTRRDVALDLLRSYRIPHIVVRDYARTKWEKARSMLAATARVARVALENDVDVMAGINNPYVAQAGRLTGIPSVVFDDTESARLINWTTLPFATLVCTPKSFGKDLGRKHLKYDGFHELAYLHPSYFTPDQTVPSRLASQQEPYVIIRTVDWRASHDASRYREVLWDYLLADGLERIHSKARVWIVGEASLPRQVRDLAYPLPPSTVLDALAGCAVYLGDGATMATEAAILGRPSIYVSPLRFGSLGELENRFELLRSVSDPATAVSQTLDWIHDPTVPAIWSARRARLLASTIDVTELLVRLLSDPDRLAQYASGRPLSSLSG